MKHSKSLSRVGCLLGAAVAALLLVTVSAEIFFEDTFETLDGWVQSKHLPNYGEVKLSAGKTAADPVAQQGMLLADEARFYAISKKLPTPIENKNKDFVVSFSVKRDGDIVCAGGYLKLLPAMDQADFNGATPYWLMFGPDRCGARRIQIIFQYKGKEVQYMWPVSDMVPPDRLTHFYTLLVRANNSYAAYLDGREEAHGDLEDHFPFLAQKKIRDPEDVKPDDWDERETIVDPDDVKPADWDDEPPTVPDPDATRPEDWNDAEDGEWEAPTITNPKYKGEWRPREIPNPDFKGVFTPRLIDNPEYTPDPLIHATEYPIEYVGFDIWQVEAGTIFDNIIIGDAIDEVLARVTAAHEAIHDKEAVLVAEAEKKEKEQEEQELEETNFDEVPRPSTPSEPETATEPEKAAEEKEKTAETEAPEEAEAEL